MAENDYSNNHYVPQWYQKRFLQDKRDGRLWYLDFEAPTFTDRTGSSKKYAPRRLPTKYCFQEVDLYTAKFGAWQSTEIERLFFGEVDRVGPQAVEWFSKLDFGKKFEVNEDAYYNILRFMSIQKLRTPKGLAYLGTLAGTTNKNKALLALQRLQNLHCAIWSESVWCILDANTTSSKFIISDHPVSVYNRDCFPGSKWCNYPLDPDIWLAGTHTLFPLSPSRILVLTNLSWARNPYQSGTKQRPNHYPLRNAALFDFRSVQMFRELTEIEVNQINFIIKKRARRYIAAPVKDWLYPERNIPSDHWRKLDDRYLLMPDPRSMVFSGEWIVRYKDGSVESTDEYGHRPGQPGFKDKRQSDREWITFHAFQGEYARLFGPRRRGRSFQFDRLEKAEDDPDYHQYHLDWEKKLPPHVKPRRNRRAD